MSDNRRLLHQSVIRGDEEAASFLISRGADVNLMTSLSHETPLHLAAAFTSSGRDLHFFWPRPNSYFRGGLQLDVGVILPVSSSVCPEASFAIE